MAKFDNIIGDAISTPKGRCAFPNLEEPDVGREYSDGKYKLTVLFDKDDTNFKAMEAAALEVAIEAWDDVDSLDDLDLTPFRDGDEKTNKEGKPWPGHENAIYITAKSKFPVSCYGPDKTAIQPKEVYPGSYVRAVVSPMAYQAGRNRGVTFLLQGVQFLTDGQRFGGGGVNAADIFDVWGEDEEPAEKVKPTAKKKKKSNGSAKSLLDMV